MIMIYFWVCCGNDGFRHHCIVSKSRKMTLLIKLGDTGRMSVVIDVSIPVIGGACKAKLRVADHSARDSIQNIWQCL